MCSVCSIARGLAMIAAAFTPDGPWFRWSAKSLAWTGSVSAEHPQQWS